MFGREPRAITYTLADADGGTDVLAVHDGLPRGLSTADNEVGWQMSLAKFAALVEAGKNTRRILRLRISYGHERFGPYRVALETRSHRATVESR